MKFYNDAIAEDMVPLNLYPFNKIKPKRFCENKISPKEEIELLKNAELEEGSLMSKFEICLFLYLCRWT